MGVSFIAKEQNAYLRDSQVPNLTFSQLFSEVGGGLSKGLEKPDHEGDGAYDAGVDKTGHEPLELAGEGRGIEGRDNVRDHAGGNFGGF